MDQDPTDPTRWACVLGFLGVQFNTAATVQSNSARPSSSPTLRPPRLLFVAPQQSYRVVFTATRMTHRTIGRSHCRAERVRFLSE